MVRYTTQTVIDLADTDLYRCPHCNKLPHIGYNNKNVVSRWYMCGCPVCNITFERSTIAEAVRAWNMHVVETDDDIADMEGL